VGEVVLEEVVAGAYAFLVREVPNPGLNKKTFGIFSIPLQVKAMHNTQYTSKT